METQPNEFFFDKTDLFNRVKRLETILGLNNDFDFDDINVKVENIETLLNTINSTYTTRTYVDNNLIAKVNKAGDTILGNLVLLAEPTEDNHMVNKIYVDAIIDQLTQVESDLSTALANLTTEVSNLNTEVDTLTLNTTAQLANKISKFGDVLYGELILANDATEPLHPVSKEQFDVALDNVVLTGNFDW